MDKWDWESLAQGTTAIGIREVFEGLVDYFPIFEVEQFMHILSEENVVQFYIGYSGYQVNNMRVDNRQRLLDFYTVS